MEKVNIAIISNVRKLRCAYRILFDQDSQSPARIVLEGPSIETFGSKIDHLGKIDLLFLDYRLVLNNTALFFSLLNDYFPRIPIFLILDKQHFKEAQRCANYVKAFLLIDLHPAKLFSSIRDMVRCYSYF
jgi:hypothetical protein